MEKCSLMFDVENFDMPAKFSISLNENIQITLLLTYEDVKNLQEKINKIAERIYSAWYEKI